MSEHRVARDVDTGLPKWVFTPKTFNPRPTWLKTPWTTVERIRRADEELHDNILRHGEEAFKRHVVEVEKRHVEKVRAMEAELDEGIKKKLKKLKDLLEWKFQKLVEKTVASGVESLTHQMAERLTGETQLAALRWLGEEEEMQEELERELEDQIQKIEERKETEIEVKKVEAKGIWDEELERIRIYEEAKTRKVHREDMTELCEGIWRKIEYLRRLMEAAMEAARRRGADDYARDAANRRQRAREAGIDNQDDDDGDNGDATDEIRREKERRELEMKLMTLSAGAKERIDHLKSAIGDVIKERRRAERNVGKVLEAFQRFADVGLGVVERDLAVDDRFLFLMRNPVMFVNPRGVDKEGVETDELRMVDGCANLWGMIKDWMMERVQGAMTRKRSVGEALEGGEKDGQSPSKGEEEEEERRSAESTVDGSYFDDEAVAKKVFDDLLRETIEAHGNATTDELLRKLSSRILKAMLSEEADDRIGEEMERLKRPIPKRGEWELVATDCMDGNRLMW